MVGQRERPGNRRRRRAIGTNTAHRCAHTDQREGVLGGRRLGAGLRRGDRVIPGLVADRLERNAERAVSVGDRRQIAREIPIGDRDRDRNESLRPLRRRVCRGARQQDRRAGRRDMGRGGHRCGVRRCDDNRRIAGALLIGRVDVLDDISRVAHDQDIEITGGRGRSERHGVRVRCADRERRLVKRSDQDRIVIEYGGGRQIDLIHPGPGRIVLAGVSDRVGNASSRPGGDRRWIRDRRRREVGQILIRNGDSGRAVGVSARRYSDGDPRRAPERAVIDASYCEDG